MTPTSATSKITVAREPFARELAICARAAERGNLMPILKTTRLTAFDGILLIENTDLEILIASRVAYSGDSFTACVDAERLLKYAQGTQAETLEIECSESALKIKAGKSKARIPTIDPSGFPEVATSHGMDGHGTVYPIPASDLVWLLSQVSYCIGKREAKFSIHSCQMERSEKGWTAVAIDGYRMAVATRGAAGEPLQVQMLLPLRFCVEAQRVFSDEDLSLTVDLNYAYLEGGNRKIAARLTVERFPDHRRYTEMKEPTTRFECDREALRRAISLACGFAQETETGLLIKWTVESGVLTIRASTGAEGDYEESLEVDHVGDPLTQTLTAGGLLEALSKPASERVKILAWKQTDPIQIIPVDVTVALHLLQPRSM